jgi:hypothetical protein
VYATIRVRDMLCDTHTMRVYCILHMHIFEYLIHFLVLCRKSNTQGAPPLPGACGLVNTVRTFIYCIHINSKLRGIRPCRQKAQLHDRCLCAGACLLTLCTLNALLSDCLWCVLRLCNCHCCKHRATLAT